MNHAITRHPDMTGKGITKPRIGIVPGDPNGIGPEVTAKAWLDRRLKQYCQPLIVGSSEIMQHAIETAGLPLRVRLLSDSASVSDDENIIDVLESTPFAISDLRFGMDREEAGVASGGWLDHAHMLAMRGLLDGTVMGPISTHSLKMAGKLESISTIRDSAYLVLRSGSLVIAHLTDHVPLAEVTEHITETAVFALIERLSHSMEQWGVGTSRIGVAGFNPHAEGQEEDIAISPAVKKAVDIGLAVRGPIGPDSIFRHCIDGRYDAVIAMYHDQGHIALKTWGFSGNSVVFLGPPYIHTTVAHGTAFDLAGSNKADASMLLHSIFDASSLALGKGFMPHLAT